MDWLERMNKALQYMEDNISLEISFEETARIACCSSYHFHAVGHLIIPNAAVRDEGTSYHYLPPSRECEVSIKCLKRWRSANKVVIRYMLLWKLNFPLSITKKV